MPKCNPLLTSLLVLVVFYTVLPQSVEVVEESGASIREEAVLQGLPRIEVVEGAFKPNATLVATLVDFDIPIDLAHNVARFVQPVFDVRGFRSGKSFKLEKDAQGLRAFEYKISEDQVLEVQRDANAFDARIATLDLEGHDRIVSGEITPLKNSLYAALAEHDEQAVGLAEKVALIFAWDVDFNTDLQVNDRIRVVAPAYYHDGQFVKWGDVQAAELVKSGKTYRAFRFQGVYYDSKGMALKRSMLASPLPFNPRVTSGFSGRRLHPILGTSRQHLAVDYGAPTGTPVQAVANGTVTFAGWSSGYGNLVQIKHKGSLTTGYAHLSSIAPGIRAGSGIAQGDLVGKVGSTGLATGPHLHYMVTRGGVPINPMSLRAEPPVPIDAKLRSAFLAHIAPRELQLGPVQSASIAVAKHEDRKP